MKKILNTLFTPNKIIGFIIFNLAFGLLIYVFSFHLEDTPLAYISYLLSTYALIIFCIWLFKICKFSNKAIKKSKPYKLYQEHKLLITKLSLIFATLFHFIYGIFKLILGLYYMSWWFITFALYYLILCLMKLNIVKDLKNEIGKNLIEEYKKLKLTGIILLLLNLILSGIIILIIKQNQEITYKGFIIYIVAIYDFYLIISAIINVIKYRNNHSPLLASTKCISLTVAMISMVSLEVAMVSQFGSHNPTFKILMTSIMGFVICLINTIMSIYMIIKANHNIFSKKQ